MQLSKGREGGPFAEVVGAPEQPGKGKDSDDGFENSVKLGWSFLGQSKSTSGA